MPLVEKAVNPFPGPVPFTDKDADVFFGREPEARELVSLLFAHRVIFLYAQSGVGKTSLLNAALIPLLKQRQFDVLPVVRIGAPLPPGLAKRLPQMNVYILNTLFALQGASSDVAIVPDSSISGAINASKPGRESEQVRVLIFDQFEEFFTSHPDRWQERTPFFEDLGNALLADSSLRLLITLREEFVASLDGYEDQLVVGPAVRSRLERLGSEAAVEAVEQPMLRSGRRFREGVAQSLVDKLLAIRVQRDSGPVREVLGEYVEPVQMQVVCRSLWEELPESAIEITEQDLQKFGDVNEALGEFYENAVKAIVNEGLASEEELRLWFERTLITPALTRSTVFRGQSSTGGLANGVIEKLETPHHVVHSEVRAGALWYELTHDRLIEPIMQSNQRWRSALSRGAQYKFALEERALGWKNSGRDSGLLLGAAELGEADLLLQEQGGAALNEVTRSYITASHERLQMMNVEQQKERADREAFIAQKFRRLSYALALACSIAFVALGFAMYFAIKADKNLLKADQNLDTANKFSARLTSSNDLLGKKNTILGAQKIKLMEQSLKLMRDSDELKAKGRQLIKSLEDLHIAENEAEGEALANAETARSEKEKGSAALADDLSRQSEEFATTPDIRLQVLLHAARLMEKPVGKLGFGPLDHLNQALQAVGPELVLSPHSSQVMNVAYSPDGTLVATAGLDGRVILWDAHTGKKTIELPARHSQGVLSVAFSPDGRQIATAGAGTDASAIVWDLATHEPVKTLLGHKKSIWAVAFGPDGKHIATASDDGTLRIWSLADGSFKSLEGHTAGVDALAWSPDGSLLASGSSDEQVKLWSTASGKEVASFAGHANGVIAVAFSPDGQMLATGGGDETAKLWKFEGSPEPRLIHTYAGRQKAIWSVAFSPDSSYLATSSIDGSIGVWSVATSNLVQMVDGHPGGVYDIEFSPDGAHLASAGYDNKAVIWNLNGGSGAFGRLAHQGTAYAVSFAPSGSSFVSGGVDGTKEWNGSQGSELLHASNSTSGDTVTGIAYDRAGKSYAAVTIAGDVRIYSPGAAARRLSTEALDAVAYSPDGSLIALGDNEGGIWLRSPSGGLVETLSPHLGKILRLAFSRDGQQFACVSKNGEIALWNTRNWQQAPKIRILGQIADMDRTRPRSVSFNADLSRVVAIDSKGRIFLWDVQTSSEIYPPVVSADKKKRQPFYDPRQANEDDANQSVLFSPDGTRFAVGSRTGELRLVETGSRQVLRRWKHQSDWDRELAFSPDGNFVASVSDDHSVLVTDTATGTFVRLEALNEWVRGVSFAADSRSLATSSQDGMVRIFDAASGKETRRFTEKGIAMGVAFSPDNRYVATAGLDGSSHLWAVQGPAGEEAVMLQRPVHGGIKSVAFSPDGRRLALGGTDNNIKVVDAASGDVLHTLAGHKNYVNGVAFSKDGSRLVTGSGDKIAKLWNVDTGEQIPGDFVGHTLPITALVVDPVRDLFVTGSEDGTAKVWDFETRAPVVTLTKHRKGITALAMTADGTRLATASSDGTVRIWDTATWEARQTLSGFGDHAVKSLSFSPDGGRLVAAGSDGSIKMFLLDKTQLLDVAQARISTTLTAEQCDLYLEEKPCPLDIQAFGNVADGNALAKAGYMPDAEVKYKQALLADPRLHLHPASFDSHASGGVYGASAEQASRSLFYMAMRLVHGSQVHEGMLALSRADVTLHSNPGNRADGLIYCTQIPEFQGVCVL